LYYGFLSLITSPGSFNDPPVISRLVKKGKKIRREKGNRLDRNGKDILAQTLRGAGGREKPLPRGEGRLT
jgi:hypothetical protein